ncbi:ATP-binding protein [Thermoplasmatales archaeon AK]|nr:ATP-binding protein [Thermoplasmatales archaeon AK]
MADNKGIIKEAFDRSERIGVIGSPSSTSGLSVDILGTAVEKRLVGNLCTFTYTQDGKDHYALGQIVEVGMRNVWAEDPTMRSLIRQRGSVEPVTERQDYHFAKMTVSSVFSVGSDTEPSMLGTIPSTGTSVRVMGEDLMRALLNKFQDKFTYLGNAYGTDIKLPMWFKHFGEGEDGVGEAYHIGVFGKTGSGKSVLSKMIMLNYAKHRQMNVFVLDPQGEFSKLRKDVAVMNVIEKQFQKKPLFISLHNLILTGDDLFRKILNSSVFYQKLTIIHQENRERASLRILNVLKGKIHTLDRVSEIKPWDYYKRASFEAIWSDLQTPEALQSIYTSKEIQGRVLNALQGLDKEEMYNIWASICKLFSYGDNSEKMKIKDVAELIKNSDQGVLAIIDLSEQDIPPDLFWSEEIRKILINEFLRELTRQAEQAYREDRLLNTLLIIDEAHRLVPRDVANDDTISPALKSTIIDGIRTTRKYGLGWMFISQTISGLDKEIINQIRAYFFGYGLAYGVERQALREIVGGSEDSINLYQLFKDPQSGFGKKEFSFMSFGPTSPLSFSGLPLFFTTFNYPGEFLQINFKNTM